MNLKTTIILLVLLALGVAALLLTRTGEDGPNIPTPGATDSEAQHVLTADELGLQLKTIQFHPGFDRPLHLQRQAGRWRITSPQPFPANPQAIDEVLSRLAELRGTPTDENFGPEPDQPALVFGDGEQETTIWLGKRLGGGRAGIAVRKRNSTQNYVVQDSLQELFDNLDTRLFYDSKIDPPLMPDTLRVEIVAQGKRSALEQVNGRWWIGSDPPRERALARGLPKHAGVNNYFELIRTIQIKRHIGYDDANNHAAFGLDRPLIAIRFVPIADTNPTRVLNVGVPGDPTDQTRFVSFGRADDPHPAVFTVDTPTALALGQSATAFRDPRLIATPSALIESISVTTPDDNTHQLSFNTDGTAELIRNQDDPVTLQHPAPAMLTTSLYDARATDYLSQPPPGAEPILTARLTARLNGEPESFTLYTDPQADADNPTVLVRRSDESVLLRVERNAVEALIDPDLLPNQP